MSKKYVRPTDYILPLNINGLEGRMIHVEADAKAKKSNLLVVYDLNSNLERWWGLVVGLKRYGNVTMADMPGFGGMDSFYSISSKPTIDNLADYLASFIKLRFRRKKLTIIGIGFGFVVITRMLQRNPDITNKIINVISLNGYAHKDDVNTNSTNLALKKLTYSVGTTKLISKILSVILNNNVALGIKYRNKNNTEDKQKHLDDQFINQFKIDLYKETDYRTMLDVSRQLLELDNCNKRVNNTVWHVRYGDKTMLNHKILEQHLRVIYSEYNEQESKLTRNVPFIFNDDKLAVKILPPKLRRSLKRVS
jgi:hypothetical protein